MQNQPLGFDASTCLNSLYKLQCCLIDMCMRHADNMHPCRLRTVNTTCAAKFSAQICLHSQRGPRKPSTPTRNQLPSSKQRRQARQTGLPRTLREQPAALGFVQRCCWVSACQLPLKLIRVCQSRPRLTEQFPRRSRCRLRSRFRRLSLRLQHGGLSRRAHECQSCPAPGARLAAPTLLLQVCVSLPFLVCFRFVVATLVPRDNPTALGNKHFTLSRNCLFQTQSRRT